MHMCRVDIVPSKILYDFFALPNIPVILGKTWKRMWLLLYAICFIKEQNAHGNLCYLISQLKYSIGQHQSCLHFVSIHHVLGHFFLVFYVLLLSWKCYTFAQLYLLELLTAFYIYRITQNLAWFFWYQRFHDHFTSFRPENKIYFLYLQSFVIESRLYKRLKWMPSQYISLKDMIWFSVTFVTVVFTSEHKDFTQLLY